jgi:signal transduction histidine kinase/CheY-like chemotaxis protein/CHASE3 domain sensor protein
MTSGIRENASIRYHGHSAVNRTPVSGSRSRAWLPRPSLIALAAAGVAVIVIAVLSYRALTARSVAAEAVAHTNEVQDQLHRFLSAVKDVETGQRGYLLTGVEAYLDPYRLAIKAIDNELAALRRLTADSALQQRRLDLLQPLTSSKLEELAETIELKRNGDSEAALALVRSDRGRDMMERVRQLVEAMIATEQFQHGQRTAAWEDTVRQSSFVMFGGVGVLFAMLALIGVMASRDFRAVEADAWVRRVQLALGARLQGDMRIASIGETVLRVLVEQLEARVGAMYLVEPGGTLHRIAGYALVPSGTPVVRLGDSLTGQAAKQDRIVHVRDLPAHYLDVSSAVGRAPPRELAIVPASIDGVVHAVVELGFLRMLDAFELRALERVSESIAAAVRTARDRGRLEELLEEVQRQAEELQVQQEQLRVSNEELEHQAQALQSTQAELETQQVALEHANTELATLAHSLERQRDELARAGAELQRSSDYKSQFLANMSHELRTPLNSSLILAKLLADNRDGNLNAEQVRFAETIHAAGNDLLMLINDILDLSKIEAGMLDVRPEPVAIARVLDELVQGFQAVAAQRQLGLEVRAEAAPELIDTDPTRLSQILRNLLANALKFTERGGVVIEVAAIDSHVEFAVRDTGIGIAADQHERIFDAFRQAEGAARKPGGTGLGLSISRDLARLLGGDLRVDSAPGRGSTFTLTLPVRSAAPAARTPGPSARRRPMARLPDIAGPAPFPDDRDSIDERSPVSIDAASRSLLIIEDDVAFARVLYDLAHELEFCGLVATTAADGLALARRHVPSAIVLDIALPDRSGLAVLDSLKRDPRTRHVPVHVISGSDHTRTALEMGAAGYALKPVERERLVDALRNLETRFTQKLRRVLIVEDDAALRDSTARLLAADDVETVAVGTTAEAIAQLGMMTFDCVVLDLSLPDRSGFDLLDDMAHGNYGFPPVIIYTGRSLSSEQIHELERFSESIIIKGARSPERLLDEVTLFLHQVESRLPPERQRMLRDARDREAVFDGRRILVVEDDVRNLFALANVLEPRGAIVDIARNGREALERLRTHPNIDLVLMDIMMPEMDGLEATREIRSDPRFARLPIIALTANAMIDDRMRCLAAGANDYIAKPLDVDKLLSLARVWIRR